MGVKSDKRSLEWLWLTSIANFIINLSLFLDVLLGNHLCNFFKARGFEILRICNWINIISIHLIFLSLFFTRDLIRAYRGVINNKKFIKSLISISIIFLGYICFWYFGKDGILKNTCLNFLLSFIPFSFILSAKKISEIDNRKVNWDKEIGIKHNEISATTSFLWRFKISFKNRSNRINRNDILNKSLNWILTRGIILIILSNQLSIFFQEDMDLTFKNFIIIIRYNPLVIIDIIIIISFIIFITEVIFNLNTCFTGECTGVYEIKNKNDYIYYKYIITSYEDKKEIKIDSDIPMYTEGDYVTVTYTPITKIVLSYF